MYSSCLYHLEPLRLYLVWGQGGTKRVYCNFLGWIILCLCLVEGLRISQFCVWHEGLRGRGYKAI